jgi:thiamine-phosphate pyrophosphorylase
MFNPAQLPSTTFLYPILDSGFSRDLVADGLEAIRAGIQMLQIRAKQASKADVLEIAQKLEPACLENGVQLIINDYVDVALVCSKAGVHLGQDDFPAEDCRTILPDRVIGFSTHNLTQFQSALKLPLDYVAIGPIFQTSTKQSSNLPLGLRFLQTIRPMTGLPIICIGGIEERNFRELKAAGVNGIALISALYKGGVDLYSTLRRMQEAIQA